MKPQNRNIYHKNDNVSPSKQKRLSDNINPDDLSDDLESVSQMLSERSAKNKNARINNMKNSNYNNNNINTKPLSTVDETKKKLEKQFDNSSKKPGYKPSPNAVPVMNFADSKAKNKSQVILNFKYIYININIKFCFINLAKRRGVIFKYY